MHIADYGHWEHCQLLATLRVPLAGDVPSWGEQQVARCPIAPGLWEPLLHVRSVPCTPERAVCSQEHVVCPNPTGSHQRILPQKNVKPREIDCKKSERVGSWEQMHAEEREGQAKFLMGR